MADAVALDAAASSGGVTISGYTISAGTNRLLLVFTMREHTAPDTPSAKYGDQNMTLYGTPAETAGATKARVDAYYLLEAGIAAATGSDVEITTATGTTVTFCRSYQHVNQSTPISQNDTAITDDDVALTTTFTCAAGSVVAALDGSGDTGQAATWTNDLTELAETEGTSIEGTMADAAFASSQSVSGTVTWGFADRHALLMVELAIEAAAAVGAPGRLALLGVGN